VVVASDRLARTVAGEGVRAVARPRVPLISKRKALEVALDIIDNEGIESLSIRRLAQRLKVNGASLYHHFENKDEILVGAANLALEGVREPRPEGQPWRIWVLRDALRLRQAFREHPDLVPIMLSHRPLAIGAAQMDATTALLEPEVPVGAIAPMLEALELYAVASALHERRDASADDAPDPTAAPHLAEAAKRRALANAQRIRHGDVRHDPRGGECPAWCDLWTMCRVARA
jgi:AcrR family transcriptional regulator